jgi:hypothetical protein
MTFYFVLGAAERAMSPKQFDRDRPIYEKNGIFYCGEAAALSRIAIEWERERALQSNRILARGLDWC